MAVNFSPSGLILFIFTIVFNVFCGAFVLLRLLAIRVSRREFYIDDGFIIFAYANVVALGGVAIWSCVNGLGKSETVLTPYEIGAAAKLLFTAYICWLLASVFNKLAILALYNRIFTTRQFKRWSYIIAGFVVAYCISFFCVYMTNCKPIDYMWNPTPGGSCRDGAISDYSTLGINLALDLAIFILPLPTLWGLQMPPRKKVVVTIMFSFGLATIAVMIWRVVWTHQYRDNPDFTTYLGWIGLVSQFELWLGVIVACIPTLAPLFKAFVHPAIKRITRKSASDSADTNPSSKQIPLQTVSNRKERSGYSRLHGSQDPPPTTHDPETRDVPIGRPERSGSHAVKMPAAVTSHCSFDAEGQTTWSGREMQPNAIYVRREFDG